MRPQHTHNPTLPIYLTIYTLLYLPLLLNLAAFPCCFPLLLSLAALPCCFTLPCLAWPGLALPCFTLPCRAVPCLASSRTTFSNNNGSYFPPHHPNTHLTRMPHKPVPRATSSLAAVIFPTTSTQGTVSFKSLRGPSIVPTLSNTVFTTGYTTNLCDAAVSTTGHIPQAKPVNQPSTYIHSTTGCSMVARHGTHA